LYTANKYEGLHYRVIEQAVMRSEELVLQETARAAEKAGDLEAAFDAWRSLSSVAANRPDYLCKLGRAAERLGRWSEAEQAFLEAIKVDEHFPLPLVLLGGLFLKRTDEDRLANARKAKEWLEQAVATSSNQASLSFLGTAHQLLGEREAAKAAFRKVIELDETYVEAYINLGLLLSADGQALEAEGLLRKAAQLDPSSPRAHGALGVLLEELGHYAEAEAELKRTLELNPRDSVARNRLRLLAADPRHG
jgi:tetratricopeptide (TPR) repeat protein